MAADEDSVDRANRRYDAINDHGRWSAFNDAARHIQIRDWRYQRDGAWQSGAGPTMSLGDLTEQEWGLLSDVMRGRPAVGPDDIMDTADVAAMLGVSESSLRAMRAQPGRHRKIDRMPAPIRTIGNAPVWDAVTMRAWWENR